MTDPTIVQIVRYITTTAERDEMSVIQDALNIRYKTLGAMTAAAVQVGSRVKIGNIRPKLLDGLTGTVERIDGKYATIYLDRPCYDRRVHDRHTLGGIPLSCCHSVDVVEPGQSDILDLVRL